MGLRIIYGKSGTGKSEYIYNEIKEIINKDEKIYIITPEQFSFTAETKLLDVLNTESVINAEVLTFKRMAYRVRNEVGNTNKNNLLSYGKSMIVFDILDRNTKKLKFLGKTTKNVDIVVRLLTELKTHSIKIEDIEKIARGVEDEYLKTKLQDIIYIYKEFENKIEKDFLDENDILTILENQLNETDMFKNTIFYIDEFVGFTPQEYKIIKKLLEVSKQVNITICTDSLLESKNKDKDIFYTNKKTALKIINLANINGIKIENPIYLNNTYRFKSKELKHIEENLYNIPYLKLDQQIENVNLFLAKNQYSEIEYVAGKIIELVRDNGYRYRDISIISRNIETYASIAKAIFEQHDIPVFIDQKKDLSQNVLIRYILSILDIFAKNWDFDSVINYLKSGFCDITDEEIFKIENYARKWGIKYNKWYSKDWNTGEDNITELNEIRKKIVTPLLKFKEDINKDRTVKQITKTLYYFLIEKKVPEKLERMASNSENTEEKRREYISSWKLLIEIFDEIVLIFGDEETSFDKFAQTLKIAFTDNDLGLIPATVDQVTFGDVNRSRSKRVKAIFIIGLNDGIFPSTNREEGFINDKDREDLKLKGIELAKTNKEQIYEENFNIYKAFTTAENKLFLTYASTSSDGATLKPSMLIYRIKKIFPKLNEESDIVNKKSIIKNQKATFEELLVNLRKFQDGMEVDPIWFEIYKIYNSDEEWKKRLNKALEGEIYTNNPQRITKENIEKTYGDVLFTSISRLEQYRRCPFSFYLKYGLNINENDTYQIQSIDTGTFMHDIIDTFFERVQDLGLSVRNMEDDAIKHFIDEIVEEKLNLPRNYIFISSAKFKNQTLKLKRLVLKAMKYIIATIKNSDFEIFGHEVEFGDNKKYPPIEITLEDGKKVEIIGKIDRVDIAKDERGKYIRIIDYKSSIKDIELNDVAYGLQLQLLTYMDAITKNEEAEAAGVLYFNLIEPIIKSDRKKTAEELEEEVRKRFKMKGLILADVKVVKMMDKNLESGYSDMLPVYLGKEEEISQKLSSTASKEQFNALQKYIIKVIKDISKEILSGKIDIKPYYKNKKTPCEFCNYKGICQFDKNKNEYSYVPSLNKDEIWNKITMHNQKE